MATPGSTGEWFYSINPDWGVCECIFQMYLRPIIDGFFNCMLRRTHCPYGWGLRPRLAKGPVCYSSVGHRTFLVLELFHLNLFPKNGPPFWNLILNPWKWPTCRIQGPGWILKKADKGVAHYLDIHLNPTGISAFGYRRTPVAVPIKTLKIRSEIRTYGFLNSPFNEKPTSIAPIHGF